MALRCLDDNAIATTASPWTGGSFTLAFWCYKETAGNRTLAGLYNAANGRGVNPTVTLASSSNLSLIAQCIAGSTVSDTSSDNIYAATTWFHMAVVFRASGSYVGTAEVFGNGVGTGSPSSTSTLTAATIDTLIFGLDSLTESDAYFAHAAFWNSELSSGDITALQTTLPSGVGSPACYWPLLVDDNNAGSGGATYDLTLSASQIDSAVDGSLPALGDGGSTGRPSNSSRLMLGVG